MIYFEDGVDLPSVLIGIDTRSSAPSFEHTRISSNGRAQGTIFDACRPRDWDSATRFDCTTKQT